MSTSSYLTKFHVKRGDLGPRIEAALVDGEGNRVNLTGISSLRFHMNDPAGDNVIDAAAAVLDAAEGVVAYEWQAGDTDHDPGDYPAEFEVMSAGRPTTFPNDSNITVVITADLA